MEKYLITGSSGFVAMHFVNYLERNKIRSQILGVDIEEQAIDTQDFKFVEYMSIKVDMLDLKKINSILSTFKPDYVLHLASFSSVSYSWKDPVLSFKNNTNIFLNLVETIRRLGIKCRIISIGSSEEYGIVNKNDVPIKESNNLSPNNPYAVARVSQEMLSMLYADGYDLDIICTRSFNHIGPYQKEIFAVASFAKQLVEIKRRNSFNEKLSVGDISIIRDFVDVRDVVRAYDMLFRNGKKGEIYNISTGKGYSLKNVIDKMCEILDISLEIEKKNNFIRPVDSKIIIGSNEKIKKEIGWTPNYNLEDSLENVIRYWESIL